MNSQPPSPGDLRAVLVEAISLRLKPVCEQWPPELFLGMVEQLADITIRYEGRYTEAEYDPTITEQIVADLKAALARSELSRRND